MTEVLSEGSPTRAHCKSWEIQTCQIDPAQHARQPWPFAWLNQPDSLGLHGTTGAAYLLIFRQSVSSVVLRRDTATLDICSTTGCWAWRPNKRLSAFCRPFAFHVKRVLSASYAVVGNGQLNDGLPELKLPPGCFDQCGATSHSLCMQSTEVTYQDQVQINTFNKANQRMHELEAELKAKQVCCAMILGC